MENLQQKHSKEYWRNYFDLCQKAYLLWRQYAGEYDGLVEKYEFLLNEKRRLNIRPLQKLREVTIREGRPELRLFEISSADELTDYLDTLGLEELTLVVHQAELYGGSVVRNNLLTKIFDFEYEIRTKDIPKSPYAMDPDACGCGRHRKSRQKLSYAYDTHAPVE